MKNIYKTTFSIFYGSFTYSMTVIAKYVTKSALRAFLYNLTLCYSEHENMKTKIPVQSQMQSLYVNDPLTM